MEIERINDNTVKFYISYIDIEDRGFEKEEIWYNRERSEQLFWQMMEELNGEEEFTVEGPLWIQVQALEKGLEILVTKAQISKGNIQKFMGKETQATLDISLEEKLEKAFGGKYARGHSGESDEDDGLWMTASFERLEDAIQLSHYINREYEEELDSVLYHYKNQYYLYLELSASLFEIQEDVLSQILEYSNESDITYHMLDEYGKVIFAEDVFAKMRLHFAA